MASVYSSRSAALIGWTRCIACSLGAGALVFAASEALGLGRTVEWASVAGIAAWVLAATAPYRLTEPRPPGKAWWRDFLSVRTAVASVIALMALFMVWWGWWKLPTDSAPRLMDPMIALVTAVLGYLFGRGEAENAERKTDLAKTEIEQVKREGMGATDDAAFTSEVLTELGNRAKADIALRNHIASAAKAVKERRPNVRSRGGDDATRDES